VADRTPLAALAGALLLAGCHGQQADNAVEPAPTTAAAASPQPTPRAPAALSRYAGHYPFDAVDGVRFLDQPAVTRAVAERVPDAEIRKLVLGGEGPGTPIVAKNGALLAWGCETHNCGSHDWAVSIAPDGSDARICYHDEATMGPRARWYLAPGKSEMRDGDCPSE